jgi:mono/diheme cytochrome c family protein
MVDAPHPSAGCWGRTSRAGVGSRTASFTPADWDRRRAARHAAGRAALGDAGAGLPARCRIEELSDIISYVRTQPRVDSAVPPRALGPMGKLLLATGKFVLAADIVESHDAPHPEAPPPAAVTIEFGRHLAGPCMGCHGADLAGGPIVGGDPAWVPARNLTPDATGLAGWTYEQFVTAMREGTRPDGSALQVPMTFVQPQAQKMTDLEMEAMWLYLQSVPAVPSR